MFLDRSPGSTFLLLSYVHSSQNLSPCRHVIVTHSHDTFLWMFFICLSAIQKIYKTWSKPGGFFRLFLWKMKKIIKRWVMVIKIRCSTALQTISGFVFSGTQPTREAKQWAKLQIAKSNLKNNYYHYIARPRSLTGTCMRSFSLQQTFGSQAQKIGICKTLAKVTNCKRGRVVGEDPWVSKSVWRMLRTILSPESGWPESERCHWSGAGVEGWFRGHLWRSW